jgi:hypothetical protein
MTVINVWFWKVRDFSLFACSLPSPFGCLGSYWKSQTRKERLPGSVVNLSRIRLLWPVALELNWKKTQVALVISPHSFPKIPTYPWFTSEHKVEMSRRIRLNDVAGHMCPWPPTIIGSIWGYHWVRCFGTKWVPWFEHMVWRGKIEQFCRQALNVP